MIIVCLISAPWLSLPWKWVTTCSGIFSFRELCSKSDFVSSPVKLDHLSALGASLLLTSKKESTLNRTWPFRVANFLGKLLNFYLRSKHLDPLTKDGIGQPSSSESLGTL